VPQSILVGREGVFEIAHLLSHASWKWELEGEISLGEKSVPMRSHVCSLAVLSLLMMVVGPAPLGTAVWTAGEAPLGVVGMGGAPLRWASPWRGMCLWDMVGERGGKRAFEGGVVIYIMGLREV